LRRMARKLEERPPRSPRFAGWQLYGEGASEVSTPSGPPLASTMRVRAGDSITRSCAAACRISTSSKVRQSLATRACDLAHGCMTVGVVSIPPNRGPDFLHRLRSQGQVWPIIATWRGANDLACGANDNSRTAHIVLPCPHALNVLDLMPLGSCVRIRSLHLALRPFPPSVNRLRVELLSGRQQRLMAALRSRGPFVGTGAGAR